MRQKYLRASKVLLSLLISISMIFSLFVGNSASAFISKSNSTTIFHDEEREIAKGVVLNDWFGVNSNGKPKSGHVVTFDPVKSDAMIMPAYGYNVNSRVTLSSSSWLVEQEGVNVIAGINGDFYYLETGVPIGLMIQNGRIASYSTTKWNAIGFKNDGSVVIGEPKLDMKLIVNGTSYSFANFNKSQNDWGPYLYSEDFGPDTATKVPSIEVILEINEGEPKIGQTITATVADVRLNAKSTPIGENQLVLSARNEKMGSHVLSLLKAEDEVVFEFKDATGQWSNVEQAIGGETILIKDGSIVSGLSTSNYNPSTAIGVKADGEVVLYQVDGRSSSSQGASSHEVAQFLLDLGCVKAIQLDGGGSSAIIARKPGHKSPGIINTPADGRERANANSLLLVSKRSLEIKNGTAKAGTEAEKLHIYPKKTYALPNSSVEYKVLASDSYYFATDLPKDIQWYTNAGTMDADGMLTVTAKPNNYPVMVESDGAAGTSQLVVLDNVTSLRPSQSVVNMQPGATVDLDCTAYYHNIKVASSDRSFTWKVEGNIGTINEDGVFTAAPGAKNKGRIIVSYGGTSAYIDIAFPGSPDTIEDFESDIKWGTSTERANSAGAVIVEDTSLAKSGSKVLRVDYDFSLNDSVEKGIAGAYAFMTDPNTAGQVGMNISKNPTGIGMWVYGDNSKTWLRAQVKDGNGQKFYIDFTPDYKPDTDMGGVDWTGWRYVEASIPSGRKGPFTIDTPIRIMCTRDEMRTKGTLYFDQIRAVYGVISKDTEAPILNVSPITDKSVINTNKVSLLADLCDDRSGVDLQSIKVFMDGALLPVDTTVNTDGTVVIKSQLGAELPLADGLHRLTFEYADFFGNKDIKTLTFTVDTGAPQIIASTDTTVEEKGTFETELSVKNPENLRKVYMKFSYDPAKVEVIDSEPNVAGKQIALSPNVKKGKVITHQVDEVKGTITLEIDGLTNFSADDFAQFGAIKFIAKDTFGDSTDLNLILGAMIVGENPASQRFELPSMKTIIEYGLKLTVTGTRVGEITVFTCTDKNGNPVSGAGLYLDGSTMPLFSTKDNGEVSTGILTLLQPNTELSFRAIKDGKKSNPIKFVISE